MRRHRLAELGPCDAVVLRPGSRAGIRSVIPSGHRQPQPAARRGDGPGEQARAGTDRGLPPQPAQHDPLTVEAQRAHRGPRRPRRADSDPGQHQVQPCLRRAAEARRVQPHPRIGMLSSPVVAGGAAPPGHADTAAVGLKHAGDLPIGDTRLELGTRQRRTVQRRGQQRPQRRLLAGDGQVPARGVLSHRGLPPEPSRPRGSAWRKVRENLLDHARRPPQVTIEDSAPQRHRFRPAAMAMPGMANPQCPAGSSVRRQGRMACHSRRLIR